MYISCFINIIESLFLLSCILLPIYLAVELLKIITNRNNVNRIFYLNISLTIIVILVSYLFFLSEKQRTFLIVYDGILIGFICIFYILKRIFSK